jgi:hypothetical protein
VRFVGVAARELTTLFKDVHHLGFGSFPSQSSVSSAAVSVRSTR